MTLKFKQIGEFNGDIVQTILKNRNIEDIRLFLNPDNSSDTNPFEIENMVTAIQVLAAHMSIYSKMALVVDADADGFLSASIIYQYIKSIDPLFSIDFIIHENKAHGLSEGIMDKLSEKAYELIIIPDAGSNDGKQIELLYAMGAEVLILDHHIIEEMPENGIIVNNQINDKSNKNLVGAGVTLKFCQAMDYVLKINKSEHLKDLAAVGQVSDASDISENEVRNLVFEGISNLNNKFLKEALLKKDVMFPVPKDLSFSVIPMINAVIRVGTLEEKTILFRALNDINPEIFAVDTKKKNQATKKFDKIVVQMNLQQYAVNIATKCKTRQDTAVKKIVAQIEKDIWDEGGIAMAVAEVDEKFASLTGLIATKMVNKLQKPVLILREKDGKFSGSGRGYDNTMSSLKDWCQDSEVFEFAQGHDQAFGIELKKDRLDLVKLHAKKVVARDFAYEVDYVSHGDVEADIILELEKNKHIFGGKVHDSLFAYMNIEVPKKDIYARGTVLTFKKNGVEFVKYGATPELIEKYTLGFNASHTLDFVGRPGVNNWLGKEAIQVVLEDVDFSSADTVVEDEITEFNIVF
jgi:single-stranded-DNA-specific exonuclease